LAALVVIGMRAEWMCVVSWIGGDDEW